MRKGDVVINRHYSGYMVREGDPYLYEGGHLIPDPPGFKRTMAISPSGVPHIGGLDPEHWYQVPAFWWYVKAALHRLHSWNRGTSWYVRPILALLLWMVTYIPKVPKKGQ